MKRTSKWLLMTMVIASLFAFSVGVSAAETVNASVNVDVQMDGAFTVEPMLFSVPSDLAESYGYTDAVESAESVSALDVLVAVHEWYYFENDFSVDNCKDFLKVGESGWISKAMKTETFDWSVAVNGECAHSATESTYGGYEALPVNAMSVVSGDTVELVKYQDTTPTEGSFGYTDNYVWSYQDGQRVKSVDVVLGQNNEFTLKGFPLMTYGAYGTEEIEKNMTAVDGAKIGVLDENGDIVNIKVTATDADLTTDADGKFSITANEAGTYQVVAYMPADSGKYIFMPVLTIKAHKDLKVTDMKDITADAWYNDAAANVLAKGLMVGISDDAFAPNMEITRSMFVSILYRYCGSPRTPWYAPFNDIPENAYYADAVDWAFDNGVVYGVDAEQTTFAPNEKITREQMAAMMARFANVIAISLPDGSTATAFADDAQIGTYAKDSVYSLVKANVIKGKGNNCFAPKDTATRAEAAQMITQLQLVK